MKKPSLFARLLIDGFDRVNRSVLWHRLPRRLGVFNLIVLRMQLRQSNLYDTRTPGKARLRSPSEPLDPSVTKFRTPSGKYNDLNDPEMGMAGTRFARNVPLEHAFPEPMPGLMEPSPRDISQKLKHHKPLSKENHVRWLTAIDTTYGDSDFHLQRFATAEGVAEQQPDLAPAKSRWKQLV